MAIARLAELAFAEVPVCRVVIQEIAYDMPKLSATHYNSPENAVRSAARMVYERSGFGNSACGAFL